MNRRLVPVLLAPSLCLAVLTGCTDRTDRTAQPTTAAAGSCEQEYRAPAGTLLTADTVWPGASTTSTEASLRLTAACAAADPAPAVSCTPADFPWSTPDGQRTARLRAAGIDTWVSSTIASTDSGQKLTQQILHFTAASAAAGVDRYRDHLAQCGAKVLVAENGKSRRVLLASGPQPGLLVDFTSDRVTAFTPTGSGWTAERLLAVAPR
ncbi:hypothetical protein [Kitasatospora sp. NPDC088346]|uniref:hypothetical protein n=1 Tax=Kitasatospora sp. NPDC088346 TaxID=3364073 RepID=UPI0038241979